MSGPAKDVLKQMAMDGSIMRDAEAAFGQRLVGALGDAYRLEGRESRRIP